MQEKSTGTATLHPTVSPLLEPSPLGSSGLHFLRFAPSLALEPPRSAPHGGAGLKLHLGHRGLQESPGLQEGLGIVQVLGFTTSETPIVGCACSPAIGAAFIQGVDQTTYVPLLLLNTIEPLLTRTS
jgi:hypothetical protein